MGQSCEFDHSFSIHSRAWPTSFFHQHTQPCLGDQHDPAIFNHIKIANTRKGHSKDMRYCHKIQCLLNKEVQTIELLEILANYKKICRDKGVQAFKITRQKLNDNDRIIFNM